jgi:hypothetical protein
MTELPPNFEFGMPAADRPCAAMNAIREALAILDAIGQGGLFDAMPDSENERRRHATGVTMLELLEDRLRQASEAHGEAGDCRCNALFRLDLGKKI